MNDRFFVLIYGTSIKGKDFTHFSSYHNVQDVVDLVRDWLERFCGMDPPGGGRPPCRQRRGAAGNRLPLPRGHHPGGAGPLQRLLQLREPGAVQPLPHPGV